MTRDIRVLRATQDTAGVYALLQRHGRIDTIASIASCLGEGASYGLFVDGVLTCIVLGRRLMLDYHVLACYNTHSIKGHAQGQGLRLLATAFKRMAQRQAQRRAATPELDGLVAHDRGMGVYFSTATDNNAIHAFAHAANARVVRVRRMHTAQGEDAVLYYISPGDVDRVSQRYGSK